MLKEAIEKIQELCSPKLFDIVGEKFYTDARGNISQIRPELDLIKKINLSSLDALVAFVKTEAVPRHKQVYITIPDHKTANCFTHYNEELRNNRQYLYTKTLDLAKAVAIVQERKEAQRVAEENREKWQQVRESRSQNAAQICAAVPEIGVISRAEPTEKEYRLVFAATATRPMLRALVEFAHAHNIKIQEVTENG